MQIVIDINDKLYDRIKYLEPTADTMLDRLMRSVQNGTQLPKGHGRLIDADELDVGEVFDHHGNRQGYRYVGEYELNNAPTIIEADVSDIDVGNIESEAEG